MNVLLAFGLLILGFVSIVAEVFFPSLGALSVIAVLSLGGGVAFAFRESTDTGLTFVALAVVGGLGSAIAAFKVFPRTPFGKRMIIKGPTFAEDPAAVDPKLRELVGKSGRALSTLRPAGIVELEGRRVDCVADGELLDAGSPVTVVRVEGNRVVVRSAARVPPMSP